MSPAWIARAVLPAARALADAPAAPAVHLRRGWRFGPHVDVIAGAGQGGALPWDEIAAKLDAGPRPAEGVLTEEEYLAQAREFGRLERVPPPYLPMREHGTVELIGRDALGEWPQPLEMLRQLALSRLFTPLAGTVDRLAERPQDALALVAGAFVALAAAHHSGAAHGTFSLRSHAEAFIAWAAPRKDPRPAFDRRLAADAATLRPLVERALAGEPTPDTAHWATGFAYAMGAFDASVADGGLTLEALETVGEGFDAQTMGPPGRTDARSTRPSAFHQAVDASGVTDGPAQWFASYRLLVNLFYSQLPLLGVPPMHRYYLCHAVAETVDQVLGETWQERLDRLQQSAAPRKEARTDDR